MLNRLLLKPTKGVIIVSSYSNATSKQIRKLTYPIRDNPREGKLYVHDFDKLRCPSYILVNAMINRRHLTDYLSHTDTFYHMLFDFGTIYAVTSVAFIYGIQHGNWACLPSEIIVAIGLLYAICSIFTYVRYKVVKSEIARQLQDISEFVSFLQGVLYNDFEYYSKAE